ncbi:hypothetical protein P783_0192 [Enterococcus faecalis GA2]|uniref:hypothetical protein n=1 Tax=Enterococcus faecalis TaxID=1351 RepID=UPI00045A09C9|nr:hypothetical protein [Enterococcus faecalis]KAJ61895.1 hypothetical protein P783_0192 [Enterococcus faecalis GA2]
MNLENELLLSSVVQFVKEYKSNFSSESPQNINFKEELLLSNIDLSLHNRIPEADRYIHSTFIMDDEIYEDIHSLNDIKELYGETYKEKSNKLVINTKIDKSLFSVENMENCYVALNMENFFKVYNRVEWVNKEKKMLVLLLETEGEDFKSDFLEILKYKNNFNFSEKLIDKQCLNQFDKFNNIYSSVYDDKRLNNYWEYPLTWKNKFDNVGYDRVNQELLETLIKIICNKDLGRHRFIIRGHKTVTLEIIPAVISKEQQSEISKLFEFILDVDKHQDKLSILRNTLTIYLDSTSNTETFLNKVQEILKTVNYNFDLYIQDKIKIFLDQKNKLLQEFISTARKIEDLTNTLISQFRTVLLSLLGTIFISLLNNINVAKTAALLNIVFLSYVAYFISNLLILRNQNKQKDALLKSLEHFTEALGGINTSDDSNFSYENLYEKHLNDAVNIYNSYQKWIKIALYILVVGFLLLFTANRFYEFSFLKDILKFIIGY